MPAEAVRGVAIRGDHRAHVGGRRVIDVRVHRYGVAVLTGVRPLRPGPCHDGLGSFLPQAEHWVPRLQVVVQILGEDARAVLGLPDTSEDPRGDRAQHSLYDLSDQWQKTRHERGFESSACRRLCTCLESRRPPFGGPRLACVMTPSVGWSGRRESNPRDLLGRKKVTPQERPNC